MTHQSFDPWGGIHLPPFTGAGGIFAIGAVGESFAPSEIPNVTRRRHLGRGRRGLANTAIIGGPQLFIEIGGVARVGPRMTVHTDLGIAVQIIDQEKLFGQAVLVGRHRTSENGESRVAVALWQVPKNLIVGAVLLDDINDMLDRRTHPHPIGQDGSSDRGRLGRTQECVVIGSVGDDLAGVPTDLTAEIGQRERGDAALLERLDRSQPFSVAILAQGRQGPTDIGISTQSLRGTNVQKLPVLGDGERRGIPGRGNEPENVALLPFADMDHRHTVIVGIGHKQEALRRIQRQGIGS